jgi:hypothetical protein
MSSENIRPLATTALLAIAEVKAATEAFNRGDANLFDALDAIAVAIQMFQAAARPEGHREAA